MVLPDARDIHSVVADYVHALALQCTQKEIAKIILHCEEAFSLVIRAGEIVQSCGVIEETILVAFMRDIVAHATQDGVPRCTSPACAPKRE